LYKIKKGLASWIFIQRIIERMTKRSWFQHRSALKECYKIYVDFFKKIYYFIDILEVQIHFLEFKRKQRKMEKAWSRPWAESGLQAMGCAACLGLAWASPPPVAWPGVSTTRPWCRSWRHYKQWDAKQVEPWARGRRGESILWRQGHGCSPLEAGGGAASLRQPVEAWTYTGATVDGEPRLRRG
jgi:hypothetical protein